MSNVTKLSELEYSIIFINSEFSLALAQEYLKKATSEEEKQFYQDIIKAINYGLKGDFGKEIYIWTEIFKNEKYTDVERKIANIQVLLTRKNKDPKDASKLRPEINQAYKDLGDELALKLHEVNYLIGDQQADMYKYIGEQFEKLGYRKSQLAAEAYEMGKRKATTNEKRIEIDLKAANIFKEIGAMNLHHQAMGMYYSAQVPNSKPADAIDLVKKTAEEFKKGHASELETYVMANYYQRLANQNKNHEERLKLIYEAVRLLEKTKEKHDYFSTLGDYQYEKGLYEEDISKQIPILRKAVEHYKKGNAIKKASKVNGLICLRLAKTRKNLLQSAKDFFESAEWFKKSDKTEMHHHMLALANYASFGTVSDPNQQLEYLKKAGEYYKLSEQTEMYHQTNGISLFVRAGLSKNIQKSIENYKLAAEEFKISENKHWYDASMGRHYYFGGLFERDPDKQIKLLLDAAKHFKNIGNKLELDCIARSSFVIASRTREKEPAKIAMEYFTQYEDHQMAGASAAIYYQSLANEEQDPTKKREQYGKAAFNLKNFIDLLPKSQHGVQGIPELPNPSILSDQLNADYEHLMGLSKQDQEREEYFKKSEELYKKLMKNEKDERDMGLWYSDLLQDWGKLDASHELLAKLKEKYGDTVVTEKFNINVKLLLLDYKRTKENLEKNQNMIRFMQESLLQASNEANSEIKTRKSFLDEVLENICKIGLQLEENSPSFSHFNENQFRDYFKSHLDLIFDGRVTSETIRLEGNTDIHIKNPDNPSEVIVVEFKIWDGENYYHKGINQLLGYNTNRDENAIYVTISKQKEWANTVNKAKDAAQNHSSYALDSFVLDAIATVKTIFRTKHNKEGRIEPLNIVNILFDMSRGKASDAAYPSKNKT